MDSISSNSYLFVVGAFVRGGALHGRILTNVSFVSEGIVKGSVYRLESGEHVYSTHGDGYVSGELYLCPNISSLFLLLDQFFGVQTQDLKGGLFIRQQIEVIAQSQDPIVANVYSINFEHLPFRAQKVLDWRLDAYENPPLSEKLSEKEKEYILRLGKTSGREIVPIQLEIYRNLMKLGLIVDKGRRLALSKLGKDVLRSIR